jgi:hypothetical protein
MDPTNPKAFSNPYCGDHTDQNTLLRNTAQEQGGILIVVIDHTDQNTLLRNIAQEQGGILIVVIGLGGILIVVVIGLVTLLHLRDRHNNHTL